MYITYYQASKYYDVAMELLQRDGVEFNAENISSYAGYLMDFVSPQEITKILEENDNISLSNIILNF